MKAQIQTTKRARNKIVKFLQGQGLKIEPDSLDVMVSGEPDKIVFSLVELRHRFRVGYVQGWTLPE